MTPASGAAAVLFEVELAFEGLVDRFDALPDGAEQPSAGAGGLVAVGGSDDGDIAVVEPCFGVAVAVALVHDQDQPVRVVKHVRLHATRSTSTSRSSVLALVSANADR